VVSDFSLGWMPFHTTHFRHGTYFPAVFTVTNPEFDSQFDSHCVVPDSAQSNRATRSAGKVWDSSGPSHRESATGPVSIRDRAATARLDARAPCARIVLQRRSRPLARTGTTARLPVGFVTGMAGRFCQPESGDR
jgi:hypothetical protein